MSTRRFSTSDHPISLLWSRRPKEINLVPHRRVGGGLLRLVVSVKHSSLPASLVYELLVNFHTVVENVSFQGHGILS